MKLLSNLLLFLLISTLCFGGVDFDGVDDTVRITEATNLTYSAFTIYARVIFDVVNKQQYLYANQNSANSNLDGIIWWMNGTSSAGSLTLTANFGDPTAVFREANGGTINAGTEYVLIGTHDGSGTATNIHIYKDCAEVSYSVNTNGSGTHVPSTGLSVIGGRTFDNNRNFNGKIKEMAVWTTQLSESERAMICNAKTRRVPLQIQPASLDIYYTLDDCADGTSCDGDAFRDETGNTTAVGNDGANNTGLTATAETVLSYP